MRLSQDVIEDIRTGNDIVNLISSYVVLNKRGQGYVGSCPFHNDSTPSFSVSPDKQLYHCFGCGASGNAISFVMAKENLDFFSAVKFLADRINYTIPENSFDPKAKYIQNLKKEIISMNTIAARFYYDNLNSEFGQAAREYLDNRKILEKTRKHFGLGYALNRKNSLIEHLTQNGFDLDILKESGLVIETKKGDIIDKFRNRIMFPIFDIMGKVIGFGGRVMDDGMPKYLNSPLTPVFDKSKNLYALNFARKSKANDLILVEGYLDTISMHQAGFTNAVASLGTAFNTNHASVIRKYTNSVTILFDSDEAGVKATLRAIDVLSTAGLKSKVLTLKDAKDPDEFIKKFGAEKLFNLVKNSDNSINYRVNLLKSKYNLDNTDEKVEFTYEVSKILADLGDRVLIDAYAGEVSKITGISEEAIKSHLDKISTTKINDLAFDNTKKNYIPKDKRMDKGLINSVKSLIYIISFNRDIYLKIKNYLSPDEMIYDVYKNLLDIIYKLHDKNENINPADLVSMFETQEEQNAVSEIFNTVLEQEDLKLTEKAVNEQIKRIKIRNIEIKIQNSKNDVNQTTLLLKEKENINKLNITLIDG